jgi:hypothetical protein
MNFNPLLADQGAPMAVIPRIKKQIERLKKLRDVSRKKRGICCGPPQL